MALFKSDQVTGMKPNATSFHAMGGELRFSYTATTPLTASDVLELGTIQEGYRVKAYTVIGSDASVTGNVNVGYLNAAKTAIATGTVTMALPYGVSASAVPWQDGDGGNRAFGLVGALAAGKTIYVVVAIVRD